MSALPPIADIDRLLGSVRFVPIGDINCRDCDVRFVPILLQKSAITVREDCLDLLTRLPTMPLFGER